MTAALASRPAWSGNTQLPEPHETLDVARRRAGRSRGAESSSARPPEISRRPITLRTSLVTRRVGWSASPVSLAGRLPPGISLSDSSGNDLSDRIENSPRRSAGPPHLDHAKRPGRPSRSRRLADHASLPAATVGRSHFSASRLRSVVGRLSYVAAPGLERRTWWCRTTCWTGIGLEAEICPTTHGSGRPACSLDDARHPQPPSTTVNLLPPPSTAPATSLTEPGLRGLLPRCPTPVRPGTCTIPWRTCPEFMAPR